jgi:hypothetical protein
MAGQERPIQYQPISDDGSGPAPDPYTSGEGYVLLSSIKLVDIH